MNECLLFRYYSLALHFTPLHQFEFQYTWKHGPGMALLQKLEDAAVVLQNWWLLQWIPLVRKRKRSAILIQVCIKSKQPNLLGWLNIIYSNNSSESNDRLEQERMGNTMADLLTLTFYSLRLYGGDLFLGDNGGLLSE